MGLVEAGLLFATEVLRPGGSFVAKLLAGGADSALVAELTRNFATVKHAKPPASRQGSSAWSVVAQGFKGGSRLPSSHLVERRRLPFELVTTARFADERYRYGVGQRIPVRVTL